MELINQLIDMDDGKPDTDHRVIQPGAILPGGVPQTVPVYLNGDRSKLIGSVTLRKCSDGIRGDVQLDPSSPDYNNILKVLNDHKLYPALSGRVASMRKEDGTIIIEALDLLRLDATTSGNVDARVPSFSVGSTGSNSESK